MAILQNIMSILTFLELKKYNELGDGTEISQGFDI